MTEQPSTNNIASLIDDLHAKLNNLEGNADEVTCSANELTDAIDSTRDMVKDLEVMHKRDIEELEELRVWVSDPLTLNFQVVSSVKVVDGAAELVGTSYLRPLYPEDDLPKAENKQDTDRRLILYHHANRKPGTDEHLYTFAEIAEKVGVSEHVVASVIEADLNV